MAGLREENAKLRSMVEAEGVEEEEGAMLGRQGDEGAHGNGNISRNGSGNGFGNGFGNGLRNGLGNGLEVHTEHSYSDDEHIDNDGSPRLDNRARGGVTLWAEDSETPSMMRRRFSIDRCDSKAEHHDSERDDYSVGEGIDGIEGSAGSEGVTLRKPVPFDDSASEDGEGREGSDGSDDNGGSEGREGGDGGEVVTLRESELRRRISEPRITRISEAVSFREWHTGRESHTGSIKVGGSGGEGSDGSEGVTALRESEQTGTRGPELQQRFTSLTAGRVNQI